jgi:hypothetical protein
MLLLFVSGGQQRYKEESGNANQRTQKYNVAGAGFQDVPFLTSFDDMRIRSLSSRH